MFKNYQKSRVFTKTIKFLKTINYKIKSELIYNVEKIFPQTLLSRLILYLIIILFIIFLILIIFIYNKHWRKIRDTIIISIANDIYYTSILINNNYTPNNFIPSVIYNSFYKFNIINDPNSTYIKPYTPINPILTKNAKILANILKNNLSYNFYIKEDRRHNITVLVLLSESKWCEFYINENAFFINSLKSIARYTLLLYIVLILVSYVFFKLLLRPLKKLSNSVILFGKGQYVKRLPPKGTLEIRECIRAFNEMKERINRYIEQRTLLLSSISHDLKSGLTKMSLMLELAEPNNTIKDLQQEIINMNHMLSNYLTFAQNEFQEEPLYSVNIKNYFNKILRSYKLVSNKNIKIIFYTTLKEITIKPITLKRAIINLLDNSINNADNIVITIKNTHNKYLKICIDDDGPGINPQHFKNVFKPFFRLNQARTPEKGSVGLGLSIVKDAINKHGGDIKLNKSPNNGLRVVILLPY